MASRFQQQPSSSMPMAFNHPFSQAQCLPLLQDYDAAMLRDRLRPPQLDIYRLQRLTEAAHGGDIFYMVLHILCCRRYAAEQKMLPNPIQPELFDVVDRILGHPAQLSRRFQEFAVSFPMPYIGLLNFNPDILTRIVSDIKDCLGEMTRLIPDYEEVGRNAKLLPLPHDLLKYCKMPSPCLQRSVFGYLLRQSWMITGNESPVLHSAVEKARSRFTDLQRMTGSVYPDGYPPQLAVNEYKFFQSCYAETHPERASDLPALFACAENIQVATLFTPTRIHRSEPTAPPKPRLTPRQLPSQTTSSRQQLPIPTQSSRQQDLPTRNHISMAPAFTPSKVMVPVQRGYRYVAGFKISPEPLKATPARQHFKFDLSQDEFDRRASKKDGQKIREHNRLSLRLRCCAIASAKTTLNESDWIVKEAAFPPYVYYSLNGKSLTYPQKDSHHKFSPIDVTDFVQVGVNTISLSINRRSDEEQDLKYGIALEVVTYLSEEETRATCLSNPPLKYEDVVTSMKRALRLDNNEDDLVLVDSVLVDPSITITITEPFSSSDIFKIPVKGLYCTHRQPFDLDVYLHTRPKSEFVPGYNKTDAWRCPICGGDARPISLVKDEFMVAVRADLEKRGMLNTRTIIVDKDGSWKPKVDKDTPEMGRAGDEVIGDKTETVKVVEREIIELD